jgi:DUF4097 and DUF4098 domain-containing protein YvlB
MPQATPPGRPARNVFQRLALAALVVLVVLFAAQRLTHAGHDATGGASHHGSAHGESHAPAAPAHYEGEDVVLFEAPFPVRPGDRLIVALSSEDLVVETGADGAGVTVLGRGADAESAFPRRRFTADYEGGTLRVETNPERGLRMDGLRASYTVVVRVPAQMNAEVNLASGDVEIGDLAGDLMLNTASGDVALGRVREAETVRVNTASGDVAADLLDGGAVTVETASGDVNVGRLAARTAALHTASGDVLVRAAGAARFEAHTASGDVYVERLDASEVEAHTASGDVSIALEQAAAVQAATGSGEVRLAVPSGAGFEVALDGPSIEIAEDLGFQGQRGRRSATGRLGAGGPRLAVTTGSGGIALVAH